LNTFCFNHRYSEDVTFVVAMIELLYGVTVPLEKRWSVLGTGVIFGDYDKRLCANASSHGVVGA
jgi:hypothetical protein